MTQVALFKPLKLGKYELQHRIVLPPLTRFRADENGVPVDIMVQYYSQRSTSGGLMIAEATFITKLAGSYPRGPGIYSREQIEGWKKITNEVHSKGSVIFLQIWHLGRAALSIHNNGVQSVSASPITNDSTSILGLPLETPRALSVDEIKQIVQDFRQAALNAMEAGFDGVEIHSASGYLLDQFINTCSNQRTDIYGGSIQNRCRFTFEVVEAIVDAIGAEKTGIRLSPWSDYQKMEDATPDKTWGYITETLQEHYPNLAYLHFVEPRTNVFIDSNRKTENSLDKFRKIWKGPFISGGGYTYSLQSAIDTAEQTGNLISFGRLFVSNPDLVERVRNNWPLNKYDRNTFYSNGADGYTDYPLYEGKPSCSKDSFLTDIISVKATNT